MGKRLSKAMHYECQCQQPDLIGLIRIEMESDTNVKFLGYKIITDQLETKVPSRSNDELNRDFRAYAGKLMTRSDISKPVEERKAPTNEEITKAVKEGNWELMNTLIRHGNEVTVVHRKTVDRMHAWNQAERTEHMKDMILLTCLRKETSLDSEMFWSSFKKLDELMIFPNKVFLVKFLLLYSRPKDTAVHVMLDNGSRKPKLSYTNYKNLVTRTCSLESDQEARNFLYALVEAGLRFSASEHFAHEEVFYNQPLTLKRLCRNAIRNCVLNVGPFQFRKIPLCPRAVREYLMLYDMMGYNVDKPTLEDFAAICVDVPYVPEPTWGLCGR